MDEYVFKIVTEVDLTYKPFRVGYGYEKLLEANYSKETRWLEELLDFMVAREYRVLENLRREVNASLSRMVFGDRI